MTSLVLFFTTVGMRSDGRSYLSAITFKLGKLLLKLSPMPPERFLYNFEVNSVAM